MHGFGHPAIQQAPKALLVFESGEGAKLKDVEGNVYTDALGGLTVAHLGHGREDIARVAYEQVCVVFCFLFDVYIFSCFVGYCG